MSLTGIVSDATLALIIFVIALMVVFIVLVLRRLNEHKFDSGEVGKVVTESLVKNHDLIKTAVSAGLASSQDTLKGSVALALRDLKVDETIGHINKVSEQMASSSSALLRVLDIGQSRGSFGETRMEQLLRDSIPSSYIHIREAVPRLGTPDAHIDSPYGTVCIDSKFPLDNYRRTIEATDEKMRERFAEAFKRDVANHINKVSKYVRPDLGTARIAYAFIPSESVYAYLAEYAHSVIEEAAKSNVIVSSPSTLVANLTLISAANRAVEITREAADIERRISGLKSVIQEFGEKWKTLYGHIEKAYSKSGEVEISFNKLKVEVDSASTPTEVNEDGQKP